MTKTTAFLTLAASLGTVAISQLLFKARLMDLHQDADLRSTLLAAAGRAARDPLLWLAVVMVLVGAICWYLSMIRLPLSFMLPMAAAIAPVVSISAHFLLGEALTAAKIAAILTVAAGVAWLGWLNT